MAPLCCFIRMDIDNNYISCYSKFTSKVNLERGEALKVTYRTKKIEKICKNRAVSDKVYGIEMSEKIQQRITEIKAMDTIEDMIKYHIGRCHRLKNNRKGQYAVDLVHPNRLVFEKHGDEIEVAHILEIVDYH